jgi:D-alanyl-D-alanine dipeptidase
MWKENLSYSQSRKTTENKDFINSLNSFSEDWYIDIDESKKLYDKYKKIKWPIIAITSDELKKLNKWLLLDENYTLQQAMNTLSSNDKLKLSFETLASIKEKYRDEYPKEQVDENNDKIVPLSGYWIEGKNVYYKYSQVSLDDLIKKGKLEWTLSLQDKWVQISQEEAEILKFDNFNWLDSQKKVEILKWILQKLNIQITWEVNEKNVNSIRDTLSLSYNNSRLKTLWMSEDIEVREEVAKRLQQIKKLFNDLWYSIEVTNWLRTPEMQKMIKENHAYFKGQAEADRLFASEENSPHLTGWAVDIIITKDWKPVNLKLRDNSQETKEPWYQINNPNPDEKQIIKLRNLLFTYMLWVWFAPNPREYWHFSYWDKMSSYIKKNMKFPK